MKKILLCMLISLLLFGCGKKEEEVKLNDWEYLNKIEKSSLSENEKNIFEKATKTNSQYKFEPINLIASQVVSGTNYMYLCNATDENNNTSLKVAIVNYDLKKNATLLSVNDFHAAKYVGKTIETNIEELTGSWNVKEGSKGLELDKESSLAFKKAIATLTKVKYTPIGLLAKQKNSDINYAILAYGKSNEKDSKTYLYVLTINDDLDGRVKLNNVAYVNLNEFNQ